MLVGPHTYPAGLTRQKRPFAAREIESNQEGAGHWRVNGHPMKIRALEELLGGGIVAVQAVREPSRA